MTREEAIAFFKDMNECLYLEAVEMAIKALEKESVFDKIFSDNATNGDMIKTIFPNLEWTDERGDTKSYILEPEHILSPKLIAFNSWWDAPYKALEQESVLDKIRTEIEQEYQIECEHPYGQGLKRAIEIIDKYRAESEVNNEYRN